MVSPKCEPTSIRRSTAPCEKRTCPGSSSSDRSATSDGTTAAYSARVNTTRAPEASSAAPMRSALHAGSSSTAPCPSHAASATTESLALPRSSAPRAPASVRTSGAQRCSIVTPAATSWRTSMPSTVPPPAAMAREMRERGGGMLVRGQRAESREQGKATGHRRRETETAYRSTHARESGHPMNCTPRRVMPAKAGIHGRQRYPGSWGRGAVGGGGRNVGGG